MQHAQPLSRGSNTLIESLEPRRMLSATAGPDGPIVDGVQLVGPLSGVTAVVLHFNQPLDPVSAENVSAYRIGRTFSSSSGSSGGGIFSPFASTTAASARASAPVSRPTIHPNASVGSAVYDDAAQTVTLNAAQPFQANAFLRFIRITGTGSNAVRGANGLALDGRQVGRPGSTDIIRYRFFRTKSLGYTDVQRSRVVLKLQGAGQIVAFLPRGSDPEPLIFMDNTDAASSILTGTIKPGRSSDGTTTIQELSGTSTAQINLGPQFIINSTQP